MMCLLCVIFMISNFPHMYDELTKNMFTLAWIHARTICSGQSHDFWESQQSNRSLPAFQLKPEEIEAIMKLKPLFPEKTSKITFFYCHFHFVPTNQLTIVELWILFIWFYGWVMNKAGEFILSVCLFSDLTVWSGLIVWYRRTRKINVQWQANQ